MPDPKPRKRGPSEYAEKDDKARQQAAEGRKPYLPPRKTRFLFKLVGLVLFALAAWLGYRFYKTGELPDVTSEEGQRKLAGDLKADVGKAADAAKPVVEEVASKVSEYVSYTLDNLRGKIKGKPPESKEEVKALVDESKQLADAKPPKPPGAPKAVEPPKPPGPFERAEADYRIGSKAFAKTPPSASQRDRQVFLRVAGKYFDRALQTLDQNPGAGGAARASLEEALAQRLYVCRKHLEINPDFDRQAAEELKSWPE